MHRDWFLDLVVLPDKADFHAIRIGHGPIGRAMVESNATEGHLMWFGADVFRLLRRTPDALHRHGGEWQEVRPGLWRVRWFTEPLREGLSDARSTEVEAMRSFVFGDPEAREPVRIQVGLDQVRWHGHPDGRRRAFTWDALGLVGVRPDTETVAFLASIASALGLDLELEEA